MLLDLLAVLGGLVLLVAGAAALVRGAAALALRLGLTPLVVGLTVVAFGTSAPELVVSIDAALKGVGGIAVGNVVGSNVANVGLILALAALLRPLPTNPALLRRDVPIMIGVTAFVIALLHDGHIGLVEGAVLVLGLVGYLGFSLYVARHDRRVADSLAAEVPVATGPVWLDPLLAVAGLAVLIGGAELMVGGAVALAEDFGVSDALIGLTIVAIGTSLPELATSVVAAVRGHGAMAAGNVVGSNVFNLLGILGAAAVLNPLHAPGLRPTDLAAMAIFAVVLVPLMLTGRRLVRAEGALLLAGYVSYVGWLAYSHG
jgi:cation:H+ antiporter